MSVSSRTPSAPRTRSIACAMSSRASLTSSCQPIDELAGGGVALHELDDRAVAPRPPPQGPHEMRIRQASDVEHEIRVERHAVLVSKAEDRDDEA